MANTNKRALSVNQIYSKKYKLFDFEGEWLDAFGTPERCGIWFIWGGSGNGKTTFTLQLAKYLANFGRVAYNSLEEGASHTMQEAFVKVGMKEVARKVILIEGESLEQMQERLDKHRSPDTYIIDSIQYAGLTYKDYIRIKEANRRKLIVLISHADGKQPAGRPAKRIMFDASLKIWVEGYRAISKGRYIGENGGIYTIWDEGAYRYWGETTKIQGL